MEEEQKRHITSYCQKRGWSARLSIVRGSTVEFVDNGTAQDIKDKYVSCNTHESGRRAFVCKHLNTKTKVGFVEAVETEEGMELLEDDDFQGWCDECEDVRQQEGEWNDESMKFANIKLVCESCYFDMKELNLGYR